MVGVNIGEVVLWMAIGVIPVLLGTLVMLYLIMMFSWIIDELKKDWGRASGWIVIALVLLSTSALVGRWIIAESEKSHADPWIEAGK